MIKKIINKLIRLYKIFVLKDKFLTAHRQWVKDDGDKTLRYSYDLNANSVVFDLGGYHGEFAQKIFDRYKSKIYVFEPVKEYYTIIKNKFSDNPNVRVFNFGLSDTDEIIEISLNNDGSSTFINEGKKENIKLKSIISFLNDQHIEKVDLLKINIEGGEYAVLPELIKHNKTKNITNLQIQFHNFIPNAEALRKHIRDELIKTHHLTYDYYFIWEGWEKNEE